MMKSLQLGPLPVLLVLTLSPLALAQTLPSARAASSTAQHPHRDAAAADAASPTDKNRAVEDAGLPRQAAGPDVQAWLDPEQVRLGQPFHLRLKIRRDQGALLSMPDRIENEQVQQRGPIKRQQELKDGQIIEDVDVPLVALALDDVRTPAFKIQLGHADAIDVAAIPLQVQAGLDDKAQAAEPLSPVDLQRFDPRPLWGLAGLLLVLALYLAWRWWQKHRPARKQAPPPPPRPAHELALEKIAALEASDLIQRAAFDVFVDEASDILRWYLGERYGFSGLDRTSSELIAELQQVYDARLKPAQVQAILDSADLVKFARAQSNAQACAELLQQIRKMVLSTRAIEPVLAGEQPNAPHRPRESKT